MLALYRAGRQADALRGYQEVRRKLGDELGIEPVDSLRELEAAILRQEPELAAPPVEPGVEPSTRNDAETSNASPPSRRRPVLAGIAAALVVCALVAIGILISSSRDGATVSPHPKPITMPYQAKLVETLGGNNSGSTFHGLITGDVVGHGTYTGISHTTQVPPVCTVAQGVPTSTSKVITTHDGDTLLQDEIGVLCMRPPTSFEFTGTFTFSGGTGCFADATGSGRITGKINFANASFQNGQAVSDDIGSITLKPKPRCPQTK